MRKWLLILVLLTGCTQHKGGAEIKFLLPWRTNDNRYSLQEVTLTTLSSPFELRGEAAEIYFQSGFSDSGYAGSIARPHVTRSGDVYVPQDADSAMAVAVYAQFERLFQYENKMGLRSQVSWPRRVGVDLNLVGPDGGSAHNNAHYFSNLDVIGLLPYTASGVPIALNQGIVAHEHFHSHFQSQVLNVLHTSGTVVSALENLFYPLLGAAPKQGLMPPPNTDTTKPSSLNNLVLRSWNEGLADFFAGIYTHQADFFTVTLPEWTAARELDGTAKKLWTGSDLIQNLDQVRPHVPGSVFQDYMVDTAYEQGTLLARLMYFLAHNGPETPDQFLVRVETRLKDIPAAVRPTFSTYVLDLEAVIPVLLAGYQPNAAGCAELEKVMSADLFQRSFASCVSH